MLIQQMFDEDGIFVGGGGLGLEDDVFARDAETDEIVGHGIRVATMFGGVFTLDDGTVGGDDQFADDSLLVQLDALGEAIRIATEFWTVALPVPVAASAEYNAVLIGFTGFHRTGVALAPFLCRNLVDRFHAEKEREKYGQASKCPLPSFVVTTEVCGYDEEKHVERRGANQYFHGDKGTIK